MYVQQQQQRIRENSTAVSHTVYLVKYYSEHLLLYIGSRWMDYGWMNAFIHSIIAGAKEKKRKQKNVSAVKFLSVAFIYSILFSLLLFDSFPSSSSPLVHAFSLFFLGQFIAV